MGVTPFQKTRMRKKLELYKKYLILSESLDSTEKEFAEKQIKIIKEKNVL